MGLIHQKQILFPAGSVGKEAFQIYVRIKQIIVIADNAICKQTHVQRHLKGTDLMLPGITFDLVPGVVLFMGQQVKYRIIDPVKMPFGIRTVLRITCRLLLKTDLILGSQCHRFKLQSPVPQQRKGLVCHRGCDGLGSQIKDPVCLFLSHGLDGRKQRGNGLAHAGGCFNKKLTLMADGVIYVGHQFLLALSVCKGKSQCSDGFLPFLPPGDLLPGPFHILSDQI